MYLGISACQTAGVNCTQYNDFDIKQKQFFWVFWGLRRCWCMLHLLWPTARSPRRILRSVLRLLDTSSADWRALKS